MYGGAQNDGHFKATFNLKSKSKIITFSDSFSTVVIFGEYDWHVVVVFSV